MARFIEFEGGDVEAYLRAQENKDLLRFITCGSVDDGKSTLIGRLLYEAKMLFEDQLSALEADSKKVGTQGGALDFALLVDGLAAEREQGITIDVAYRAFTTDKRKFIVADTPGHEQYTRNMATGASTADLAVILIDARKGVLTQTRRHTFIVIPARHPQHRRRRQQDGPGGLSTRQSSTAIEADYRAFAKSLGIDDITCIPLSALAGDNVIEPSAAMPWYHGPTLMAHLETVPVDDDLASEGLPPAGAMGQPPGPDFPRLFRHHRRRHRAARRCRSRSLPSGKTAIVERIVTYRWRSRRRRRRPVGDHHPHRRDRCQPRRCDLRRQDPVRGRRPVRGANPVDG